MVVGDCARVLDGVGGGVSVLLGDPRVVMSIRILGPVEAWAQQRRLELGGRRQLTLFAFLVLHANRAVSRDALIDAVWGSEGSSSGHRLSMAIGRLRQALEPLNSGAESRLRTVSGGYLLTVAPGELDSHAFADHLSAGRRALESGDPGGASEVVGQALAWWRGPALAEVAFEDFAQPEIRRLEEMRLEALEVRVEADLELGRHSHLVGELEGLLVEQPTRERIAGQLMTALYRCGRQAEALEVYQRVRIQLVKDLGVEPGPALKSVHSQVLGQAPALSQSREAAGQIGENKEGDRSPRELRSQSRSNLPTPTSALVGRTKEVSRALELLAAPQVRLLTLWGPGGSGKTRLALEVAAATITRYRDGSWIVPLAPIRNRSLMVSELARVLGVTAVAGEPLERTLVTALSERELLLVLDNFEHLLDAGDVVVDLLSGAQGIDVLSTSREPLRIRGEQRMEVPPLPPPDAAELFVARAKSVRPDLTIEQEDRATIERICARLDGLPLALELAAALVAVFSPRRLEVRLGQRLTLPEGPRDLPERQRTLRATIDWSYQLLEPSDRSLLAPLGEFIGGVRLDSAETIWGPDALDRLISLVEKSLLRRREDHDGEPRFWMLETIREFALERLTAEGQAAEAADLHATHFLAVTEEAAAKLLGPEQHQWLDRLEDDHANLRAALDHLTKQSPGRAVQMAANLEWFWVVRGYTSEGRTQLAAALAAAPADCPRRAEALAAAGQMALQLGDAPAAEPLLLEALSLAEPSGARVTVLVLSHLGWAAEALGDPTRAAAWHRRAVAAARAGGDDWALGLALNNDGVFIARTANVERARRTLEEALTIGRRTGEPQLIALAINNLAEIAVSLGDLDEADRLSSEALKQAREIGFRSTIASALHTRAEILIQRGDLESASAQLHEAVALVLVSLAPDAAASLLSVAGTISAMRGQALRAAMLWAAADNARARVAIAESSITAGLQSRYEATTRSAVADTATWETARADGTAMTTHDALALAADEGNNPAVAADSVPRQ